MITALAAEDARPPVYGPWWKDNAAVLSYTTGVLIVETYYNFM